MLAAQSQENQPQKDASNPDDSMEKQKQVEELFASMALGASIAI